MVGTRNRPERNQTERTKSRSNTEIEIIGKHKRAKVISLSNTINGLISTETFGTNRPATEITEKERTMEMGRRTTERFWKIKTNVNRRPVLSTLCKR